MLLFCCMYLFDMLQYCGMELVYTPFSLSQPPHPLCAVRCVPSPVCFTAQGGWSFVSNFAFTDPSFKQRSAGHVGLALRVVRSYGMRAAQGVRSSGGVRARRPTRSTRGKSKGVSRPAKLNKIAAAQGAAPTLAAAAASARFDNRQKR